MLALLADADDARNNAEKIRMRREANDLLDGRAEWPAHLRKPYEIHDWSENRFD